MRIVIHVPELLADRAGERLWEHTEGWLINEHSEQGKHITLGSLLTGEQSHKHDKEQAGERLLTTYNWVKSNHHPPPRGRIPQSDTVMCGMPDRLDTNKKLIKPLTCFEPILFQFRTWICKITGDVSNIWWYHPWLIAWEAIGISNMHKQTHWRCICWLGWTDCGCAVILISRSLFFRQLEFRDADSWTQHGTNRREGWKDKQARMKPTTIFDAVSRVWKGSPVFTCLCLSIWLQIHYVLPFLCTWDYLSPQHKLTLI